MAPLDERHRSELQDLEERIERYGLARGALKTAEERHKRERRKFRTDELRFGLAVLARACRDRLAARLAAPVAVGAVGPDALGPFAGGPGSRAGAGAQPQRGPAARGAAVAAPAARVIGCRQR